MVKRSSSKQKPRTSGNRKNMTLVALAGFLLVVWGFVLGILVGRGTVPTIIPDRTAQTGESRAELKNGQAETSVTEITTTTTTVATRPSPTTTLGFYTKLSEEVTETLPPLPPPTTGRAAGNKLADKPSSSTKPRIEAPPKPKEKPKAEPKTNLPHRAEPSKPKYSLQVAAFAVKKEAQAEARKVADKTEHKVRVVASKVKGKVWYRVRVGGFATKAEARSAARTLKAAGMKAMLVRAVP